MSRTIRITDTETLKITEFDVLPEISNEEVWENIRALDSHTPDHIKIELTTKCPDCWPHSCTC